MSRSRLLAGLCLVLVAVGASVAEADQLRRDGRWHVDGSGRVVLLHGENAVWKLAPYAPPAVARGFVEADAQWLEDHGLNAVRLGVLFVGVMPERGVIDTSYLEAIDRVVQLLAAHHIYVLLDFHQDLYNEKFQGEGFPDWSVYDDGIPHFFNAGFPGNYFTPEVMRTFDNLWANKMAAGDPKGLWDYYADAWRAVVSKWKDQPYLMGYDLLNEPWPGSDWPTCANPLGCPLHDTLKLQAFQQHVLEGIRALDSDNIVWFEPNVTFNSGAKSGLGLITPVVDANLGLSWHNYCLPAGVVHSSGITDVPGCELLHQIPFDNANETIARLGATQLVTEFGASDDIADLKQVTRQADQYFVGWLYWHYKEWGDPTTESQTSGGQGLFYKDDDLTTLKPVKGQVLIRPYPRATAGTPQSLSFDPVTREFSYRYQAGGGTTEIFVPDLQYGGSYDFSVKGGTGTADLVEQTLHVAADPGSEVTVTIMPGT